MLIESFSTLTQLVRVRSSLASTFASQVLIGACPDCGGDLVRVHRCAIDRLLSVLVPVRRFRCADCVWEGLATRAHWHSWTLRAARRRVGMTAAPFARPTLISTM